MAGYFRACLPLKMFGWKTKIGMSMIPLIGIAVKPLKKGLLLFPKKSLRDCFEIIHSLFVFLRYFGKNVGESSIFIFCF